MRLEPDGRMVIQEIFSLAAVPDGTAVPPLTRAIAATYRPQTPDRSPEARIICPVVMDTMLEF
jgi:hypothetical protein